MLSCLFVSLFYNGSDIIPFVWSILITVGAGFIFRLLGRHADNLLGRRDAYFVVTISWILFTIFGTLPFMISGGIGSFTDAFFEAMSGFTTTGATIIDYPEYLPKGLLFWRSLTQWIGGLGIVFFTIAILPSMVGGSVKVFAAEATGPIKSKLHPRLSTSAKWIWVVYLVLTTACILSYKVCGMGWFDAFNYSMTSTATGGFSPESGSITTFHSPAEEYVSALFCFLSGVNFTLLYASAAGLDIKKLIKNSEFRFYTTMVLAACMFFGGCSGSTSGGIKSIRGVMLLKVVRNEFRQILHPNAVLPMKVDGVNIPQSKRVTLLGFIGLYLILTLFCAFTMIAFGIDNTNAITITLSCLGNVGPTLGMEIGPTMSWAQLPDFAKWICSFLMLVGRLELFTVLVLFSPAFWKEN